MTVVKLDPQGYYRRVPLTPERMVDRRTPTQDAIVLCHVGVPRLTPEQWSLTIDGLVERPLTLRFEDLQRLPKAEVTSFHQCAGSPLQPFEPTRRVCNVNWAGARLNRLLAQCRPARTAQFLWSYGADGGEFNGVRFDAFAKDMPLDRIDEDVLIVYEMNGAPLAPEHGFPARLVVPGFYGTNSVKWLTRMTLADRRADSPFTTRWYNDPVLDAGQPTGDTTPVWSIAPESLIVAPGADAVVTAAAETQIWGWAWADGGVARVDVSTDACKTWRRTEVEPPGGREWQRFSCTWTPTQPGAVSLAARATGCNGISQPDEGRRNAIHRVAVHVA